MSPHRKEFTQIFSKENKKLYGWCFQEFVKLQEVGVENLEDVNLIWDADTVHIRKLNFYDEGKIEYFTGRE